MLIKFIVIFFVIFAIWRTIVRLKREEIRIVETAIWVIFWLIVGTVAIIPQTTDIVAQFLGVSRGVDLLVYISIVVLFFIIFKIIVKLEKIERNVTKIVRHLALKDVEEEEEEGKEAIKR